MDYSLNFCVLLKYCCHIDDMHSVTVPEIIYLPEKTFKITTSNS